MKNVRMRLIIEGRFQGINFRYQTQQKARQLELVGFVRSLSDGRIEIEAEGLESKVQQLLDWCQEEPYSKHIKSLMFRYDEPGSNYSSFNVR